MILRPDNEASIRVRNWLNACITDVKVGDADASVLLDVVEVLQDYVAATKVRPTGNLWSTLQRTDQNHRAYLQLFSPSFENYSRSGMVSTAKKLSSPSSPTYP